MTFAFNFLRAPRFLLLTALAAVALGAAACNPSSSATSESTSGSGGSGGGGGAVAHPPAVVGKAIGRPHSHTGPIDVDPNTLVLQIANHVQTCPGSLSPACTGDVSWLLTFNIPPALQVPGVLQLSNPDLRGQFSVSGASLGTPGDCVLDAGSFSEGTLQIVSIDATTIVVKLAGTSGNATEFAADGEYTAPICPTGV